MIDYIITAKHYAERDGYSGTLERIHGMAQQIGARGRKISINDQPTGAPVLAEIEFGQWIARCPCGGAEFVDPETPIYFCFSCGNRTNRGHVRHVHFPAEWKQIEKIILERPVNDDAGLDDLERAYRARPIIQVLSGGKMQPLTRCWEPGESIDDLIEQNRAVLAWEQEKRK